MAVATSPTAPRGIEAVPTTLARIEGTINLVAHDVTGLASRMDRVEAIVRAQEVLTARLDFEAGERDRLTISTALTIKTEKDNAATVLATEKEKKETKWSPFAKSILAVNALVGLTGLGYLFIH